MYGQRGRGLPQRGGSVSAMADIEGGTIGVETRFRKITACPDMLTDVDSFPKFRQKNHRFGHLETIWDGFGHSKYLVILAFGRKHKLWQAPTTTLLY